VGFHVFIVKWPVGMGISVQALTLTKYLYDAGYLNGLSAISQKLIYTYSQVASNL